jgi:signal peptidase I
VIGLPGETIELKNKKVHVNGKPLDETYVHFLYPPEDRGTGDADFTSFDLRSSYGPVTVPADHYFMMGDNRDNSQDSRYWGFMPRSYVKGKALFVYFSFGDERPGLAGALTNIRWNRLLHQIH